MVQTHGHRDSTISSSKPRATMRISLRGSKPSTPETGQELAQSPQVTQKSWE
jgi:hypothetical protein